MYGCGVPKVGCCFEGFMEGLQNKGKKREDVYFTGKKG
jgi:hypothetical protein